MPSTKKKYRKWYWHIGLTDMYLKKVDRPFAIMAHILSKQSCILTKLRLIQQFLAASKVCYFPMRAR